MNGSDDEQRKILHRLKRAQGQLNAVVAAVEAGGDCREVVTQLSAVTSALDRAGFAIISSAMRDCFTERDGTERDGTERDRTGQPEGKAPLSLEQLEKLFLSLA